MKHCRKYADFARFFGDAEYVAVRLVEFRSRMVRRPNGCVEIPATDATGYAKLTFGGKVWQAHRLLWIIEHGDIGDLVVDHVCRNKLCVNLAHLDPVPNAINVLRGKEVAHGGKCAEGHEFQIDSKGRRSCLICKRAKQREKYATDPAFRALNYERTKRLRAI
jgi:hypothetical protein